VIIDEKDYLSHYGILRKSGRYPWGSGETQSERNQTFLGMVEELRKKGLSETEIARGLGIVNSQGEPSTTQLRAAKSIAKTEEKQAQIAMAQRLKDKGYSNIAIGERMNLNESSVRALLAPGQRDKTDILETTATMLKGQVGEKKYVDIGTGVERHIGVSQTKLATAVARLQEEGYTVHYLKVEQLGTGQQTTLKVLAAPGTTYGEVFRNRADVKQVTNFSDDGGRTYLGIQPPLSIKSRRVGVRYAEQGGADADGVIYVRPGVRDLSLGASRYAQVRIAVDGTHYLKGMAMYKDDLPDGVDLLFNTNKSSTGNKLDAMKALKDDPDNPFGAVVRQIVKTGSDGKSKVVSAMNIVNEEGDWGNWSKSLSSQMLSKQSPALAKSQLAMTFDRKQNEFNEINALTNPAIRKRLLDAFADDADASAVHLKAASLPRQGSHVILPINSMSEKEIFAPNYRDGESVVLIRYPHGGIFEIPELKVNNRHPEAKRLLAGAKDAVGINSKVAARLSGADFDGDTVLVIPNNFGKIKTAPALSGLKGFDPQASYPGYEGMKRMDARTKAFQMGDVSNLITDMTIQVTIQGANPSELARAVRHSMVVIDAEKHGLNWKQSAVDNGIAQLKAKYQGSAKAGASTLISRATSRKDVPERKQGFKTNPVTGERIFTETGNRFVNAQGKTVIKTQRSTKLAETTDAHTLSSGTVIEKIYADHSNALKALANRARLESVKITSTPYSPSARLVYAKEVAALNSKLNIALRNAPLERQAQVLANAVVAQKRRANPDLEASEVKRLKGQALAEARIRTGAKKQRIVITPEEWNAIQAGAITTSKLNAILNNSDLDVVKQLATPKAQTVMTSAKKQRAQIMLSSGYTQAEVADALGISVSTLKTNVGE